MVTLVVVVGVFLATIAGGHEPVLGLDLQGGVSVVLSPVGKYKSDTLDVAIDIIRNRVDTFGTIEPRDHPPGQRHRDRPARREGPRQGGRARRQDRRAALPAGGRAAAVRGRAGEGGDHDDHDDARRLRPRRPTPQPSSRSARRPPSRRATTPPCPRSPRSPRRPAPATSATRASCCPNKPGGKTPPATTSARPGLTGKGGVAPPRPSSSRARAGP